MFGFGKRCLRRFLGISDAQRRLSRRIGIPLSRAGANERLAGNLAVL